MFQNHNMENNEVADVAASTLIDGAQHQHPQENINYNEAPQPNQNQGVRRKPFVKITEQPATKALRFRYECEGRSAGSIPGVSSTPENKTYPTIEIVGYKGRAVVVVSCVTKDQPYRPHPHNLVGKEGCKKGVCTLEINSETMRAVFSNLGIQCVKKRDIETALKAREEIRVDPFKTGFSHRFQPSSIDLNVVRLCFQVFMESEHKGRFTQPLPPVVSDPIYDKKAMSDLVICRLCSCSASVVGNTQIILLCEKVAKEDIAVRFFEEKNNQIVWEAYGEFQHTDVHKQIAITFKTPRYHTVDIVEPAKVFIQLRRPSDGMTSEALHFEYVPLDSGRQSFWNLRRNHKRKPDLDLFQQILGVDISNSHTLMCENNDIITDLDEPSVKNEQIKLKEIISYEDAMDSSVPMEVDVIKNQQKVNNFLYQKTQELEQEQQQSLTMPKGTEEGQNDIREQLLEAPQQIYSPEKINEWMKYNEAQTLASNEQQGIRNYGNDLINDDKTLSDLLDQVVELDEIYSDHVHCPGRDVQAFASQNNQQQQFVDRIESFDDAATYSSLQIAFRHPIDMPVESIIPIISSNHLEQQIVVPDLENNSTSNCEKNLAEDKKLPPLPPKRMRKLDTENFTNESNQTQIKETSIIIMKTPDRIPSPAGSIKIKSSSSENPINTKNNTHANTKQKKGFFSKLFSRRKSNSDLNQDEKVHSNASTKKVDLNNTHRASMRSVKSFHASSSPSGPKDTLNEPVKNYKSVTRSVSSVSGKRSTRLNAEVIHIPLKGESVSSLPQNEAYSHASTITLDRRTVSALQVADIPINDGNMELVAIADRQSLRNLCEGEYNIQLDPNVDLTEAEHYALYTSVPPKETSSEFDENSLNPDEILSSNEIAQRLTAVNRAK